MFNVFTISFGAVFLGLFLAVWVTRQKSDSPLQLVPPEDDFTKDPKSTRKLTLVDLLRVGERQCAENQLTITEKIQMNENEVYWIVSSANDFFFGNYVLSFFNPAEGLLVNLPKLFEFKDFIKSVQSNKGFFLTTGYFSRDVHQPLEGPKISLYNRLRVIHEMSRLGCGA